jgi:beta-phosphoglucomutase
MLRALIFDFNGVISDDEAIHQEALGRTLTEEGISISEEQYLRDFLGRDDRDCLRMAFEEGGRRLLPGELQRLIGRKTEWYLNLAPDRVQLYAGVLSLLEETWGKIPMAIASGALRHEVELVLEIFRLRRFFCTLVTQEDVSQGKPHPEIFLRALAGINQTGFYRDPVWAEECLVVEDSPVGIEAARTAGMRCLAVSHTQLPERLSRAHRVVPDLRLNLADMEFYFENCMKG